MTWARPWAAAARRGSRAATAADVAFILDLHRLWERTPGMVISGVAGAPFPRRRAGVSDDVRFDERFLDEIKSRLRPSDVIGRTVKLQASGPRVCGPVAPSPRRRRRRSSSTTTRASSRLLVRQARRPDQLPAGDRAAHLRRGGASGWRPRRGVPLPAGRSAGGRAEEKPPGPVRMAGPGRAMVRGRAAPPRRRGGARAYLEKRGLPEDEWARFRLGFSPAEPHGAEGLPDRQGGAAGELVEAGLLIAPEDGGQPYDRFRDRHHLPHRRRARADRLVRRPGDGSRGPGQVPERAGDPLFHKGHTLYGLPEARKILAADAPERAPPLVVVEGYMDVIACQRAGIAAVAPMGTALTEEQMEMLWRVSPRADPLLRRRRGGPAGGLPLHRPGAAAAEAGRGRSASPSWTAARTRTTSCASRARRP